MTPERAARRADVDVVVLQRPHELSWLASAGPGRRPGHRRARRLPRAQRAAGHGSTHAPPGSPTATTSRSSTSPTSTRCSGTAATTPTRVIEHGIVDPGAPLHRRAAARRRRDQRAGAPRPGHRHRPAARLRRAGAGRRLRHGRDRRSPSAADRRGRAHDDLPQARLHDELAAPPGLPAPVPLDLARPVAARGHAPRHAGRRAGRRPRRPRPCRPRPGSSPPPRRAGARPCAGSLADPDAGRAQRGPGRPRGTPSTASGSHRFLADWDAPAEGGDAR